VRARARTSPRVRPEVADALGGLEQSLVDVATLQRLQASPVPPPPPPPAGSEVPSGRVPDVERDEEVTEEGVDGGDGPQLLTAYTEGMDGVAAEDQPAIPLVLPPPPPASEPPSDLPPELLIDVDPAVRPVADDAEDDTRILSRFSGDQIVDQMESSGAVLAAARGVEGVQPPTPAQMEAEQRARRGSWLMWAGAFILVAAAAAFWLIPDRGDDSDKLPAVGQQSTTTEDSLLLDPDQLTTTSVTVSTTTSTTAAPAVTAAPTTTAKPKSKTKTSVTTPPTTPTTVAQTTTTLGQPGPPGTSEPRPLPTTTVVTVPPATEP
jgi:hypothetical protein